MFICPMVSEASLRGRGDVDPERAVLFIKCDDEGSKHGNKYGAVGHSLFRPAGPVQCMEDPTNVLLGLSIKELRSQTDWWEEIWKK